MSEGHEIRKFAEKILLLKMLRNVRKINFLLFLKEHLAKNDIYLGALSKKKKITSNFSMFEMNRSKQQSEG